MFTLSRSPVRRRSRLILEELESRTLLSASILDNLPMAPQLVLTPASGVDVSITPQQHHHGGGGGSTTPPGYSPSQTQTAYGFNLISFSNGPNGTGQTIGIVDAYNDAKVWNDLSTFDSQFNLANPPSLTVRNQSGQVLSTNGTNTSVAPPSADPSGGWELEESLDVEWAHAMAPGASIVLVEANSSSISDLMTAVQTAANNASVVSMSWGAGEFSGETSYDSYFQPYTVTNPNGYRNPNPVTFVAASGDSGAPPIWPAVSPNVVAVGGTSLTLSNGSYGSETAWSSSGGGISQYEAQPAGLPTSYTNGNTTGIADNQLSPGVYARTSPDVAYNADPNTGYAVYDSTTYYPYYPYTFGKVSGWVEVGGTSAGAPQWSALVAIADQGRVLAGNPTLSGAAQTLPALYNMKPSDFHDITSGTSTGSPNYTAGIGYDLVTGRGTPYANLVVNALESATSTGGVGGLVATGGSTTPSPSAKKADVVGGDPSQSPSSPGSIALAFEILAASDPKILVQPAQISTNTIFPFGTASVLSSAFGTGQNLAAVGGISPAQASSSLAAAFGYQFYAPAPKSISSPPENLGNYLNPFRSYSPDAVPATRADDSDQFGGDGPQVPRRTIRISAFLGDIDLVPAPAAATERQGEEAPACDAWFVDEASMAFLAEEGLAEMSGANELLLRLRVPTLALLGVLASSFWMAPDTAEENRKRRVALV